MDSRDSTVQYLRDMAKRAYRLIRGREELWREAVMRWCETDLVDRDIIPFPSRDLTRDERMVVLAAVYHVHNDGLPSVAPWGEAEFSDGVDECGVPTWFAEFAERLPFAALIEKVKRRLPAEDYWKVEGFVEEFEMELQTPVAGIDPATRELNSRYPLVHKAGLNPLPARFPKPCGNWKTGCWPVEKANPAAVVQWLDYLAGGERNPLSFGAWWQDTRHSALPTAVEDYLHDAFWAVTELARHNGWHDVPVKPQGKRSLDEVRHDLLRLKDWIEARIAESAGIAPAAAGDTRPIAEVQTVDLETELKPLELALALLVNHPEWTDTRIAAAVGVSRTTLYKPSWEKYQKAREAIRATRDELPKGAKGKESGRIEAWDSDNDSDARGDTFGDD
jgi:hypothetical protein